MRRLIDVDVLLDGVDANISHMRDFAGNDAMLHKAVDLVQYTRDYIAAQYIIEAEPVRHGRWECEFETYGKLRCSVCKKEALLETANDALYATSNYCPNCGAKMDGDSHD